MHTQLNGIIEAVTYTNWYSLRDTLINEIQLEHNYLAVMARMGYGFFIDSFYFICLVCALCHMRMLCRPLNCITTYFRIKCKITTHSVFGTHNFYQMLEFYAFNNGHDNGESET